MSEETVADGWREAVTAGRFDEAYRLYLVSGEEEAEPHGRQTMRSISALADILQLVREKAWGRARRQLERLEDPQPLVDWDSLRGELDRLEETSDSLDQREAEEALERLEGAELRWFEAEAANQRGTARVYLGEADAALSEFERAVELDPRHFRALTNLGNAKLEAGQVEEAIGLYRRALDINDEFANAHHNLGVAYRRQGKIGLSVRHLRRAQRVQQRVDRERARERIGGGGEAGLKALRWSLMGLAALALYMILRTQGFF